MNGPEIGGFLTANEAFVRVGFFFGLLAVMAAWEVASPRRALTVSKTLRWTSNLLIVFLNTVLVRLILPTAGVGVAVIAQQRGWGLLNNTMAPEWLTIIASVVFLDLVIYLQHVLFHAAPSLWRLHRMHHADLDYDVTTGSRFHPIEIILSMLIKMMVVAAVGAPPVAVVLFEIILNATAMFNHGNVYLPDALDRVLRLLIVTPDMHRVHHSALDNEANSNFGFNLSVWDRLLGTYLAQPSMGHEGMTIGLKQFRDPRELKLHRMLAQPFMGEVIGYTLNRKPW